jgi:predicted DNA-binding protein with PD1-like motif
MKTLAALLMLLATPAFAAQEIVIVPTPPVPSDSRPNNPAVPDVYTTSGQFERIVVMRMKFGTDLLADIEKAVADEHIRNAVILSGIGSVRGFKVHQMANRDLPTKNIFTTESTTPADLDSISGYVINGKVHAHIVLGVSPDRTMAGHLEHGTEVFSYAVVTVGVLTGVDLSRVEDKGYR